MLKKSCYVHTTTNATTATKTIATIQAKGIKVKFSRNIWADGELNQNNL